VEGFRTLDAILCAGALALLVLGFTLLGTCSGGISLILFAGGIAALCGVIVRIGGYAMIVPAILLVLILVAAGLVFASSGSCSL
jgi:hypothetical protein